MSLSIHAGRGASSTVVAFGIQTPTTMRVVPTVRTYTGTVYVYTPTNIGSSTGSIGIDTGSSNLTFPAHFRALLQSASNVSDNRVANVEIYGLQLESEL